MTFLIDAVYLLVALVTSPVWLFRMVRTGKIRTDWAGRFGRVAPFAAAERKRILLHAVSVGEVNAIRMLIRRLAERADGAGIVVAATTDTGFERASRLFGSDHRVVRYPLDLSFAVNRFLDAVRPDVVVLVELEVWPSFTLACSRRRIPVCVVNGRLTQRSYRAYRLLGPLIRPSFGRLAFAAAQQNHYARRFRRLGVPGDRVYATGTMKWDTAEIADHVEGADELARQMGIDRAKPLVVAGSTAPGEHKLLVKAVGEGVQLLCAPRRPEWFDRAATALPGCVRRSRGERGSETGRFLLDTIGELRLAYAIADVVVVGRTFGNLHGSDMMEPVALGKATVVGPAVADFADTVEALKAGDGIIQTNSADLPAVLRQLLESPARRRELADGGRAVIKAHQGATDRHVRLIMSLIS